jgi:high-affinity iron transporter
VNTFPVAVAAPPSQPKPELKLEPQLDLKPGPRWKLRSTLIAAALLIGGIAIWKILAALGTPDPTLARRGSMAAILDIGILVFREGLECILVLSAITAGMRKAGQPYSRPVSLGVVAGLVATLATWFIAIRIVSDLSNSFPALYVQAGTGLLAIIVLLVVMNWFFHKIYWTGWIAMHNRKKRDLLERSEDETTSNSRVLFGMAMLGFTSLYREGVEVVLFLQSYRLKLGGATVGQGVLLGLAFTAAVAVLTFAAHRKLPYRRMLVFTGVLLGAVLMVMVGEQAQEMQLAHWLPTTTIPWLNSLLPGWVGLWFSIFPTWQTLTAQALAAVAVVGSYFAAQRPSSRR